MIRFCLIYNHQQNSIVNFSTEGNHHTYCVFVCSSPEDVSYLEDVSIHKKKMKKKNSTRVLNDRKCMRHCMNQRGIKLITFLFSILSIMMTSIVVRHGFFHVLLKISAKRFASLGVNVSDGNFRRN